MNYKLKLLLFSLLPLCAMAQETFSFGTKTNPQGVTFEVDSRGFIVGGKHILPVMGEIHFSRVPAAEWKREIQKMRAGGITIIATYCFWIHHEATEGQWDWSGNKNLRQFLQVCKEENMPVVLRIGPFCHGEVYQGGFPVWIVEKALSDPKNYKLRSTAPGFLAATKNLYENIFAQAKGMLWKDGGPVVGVQIENECRGPWGYYMALRDMAVNIGFDVPFMTRTGWPKLNGKEEFGKLLPLYGDYADGFWDRTLDDMPGDYPKAFIIKEQRINANIATETFSKKELSEGNDSSLSYPYLTCELGGGMMPAYHRRINMSGNEAMPLAICKLGSGSNLPGYYMYHGGTNPYCAEHTMAETQATKVTNYNDMPYMSYDFQAPLGEMGQPNINAFHQTRLLHQFLADWGEMLSQMDVDSLSDHYARRGCFEFYNDYVRILNEDGRAYVRPVDMPFNGHCITADAQPFCKIGNTLYFIPIKGMTPKVWVDGKEEQWSKVKGQRSKVEGLGVALLSSDEAMRAFKIDDKLYFAKKAGNIIYKDGEKVVEEEWKETKTKTKTETITITKTKDAAAPRIVPMGSQKVAAMPTDADFENAAVWNINLEKFKGSNSQLSIINYQFLKIDYAGDCARIYADGKLVMDNFWNGKPMLVRMSDLAGKNVELRILPLRKDAPIYLQKEQKALLDNSKDYLLQLENISILSVVTSTK
ncbi:MAG: beta-galactosidase [Prevotella sp.]|nr:beta-galactosidase [Prevotella sp.]